MSISDPHMEWLNSGEPFDSKSALDRKPARFGGLVIAGITGGAALALSVVCYPFVSPAFRRICLPFLPATTRQMDNVFSALRGKTGRLIDIGSGDGRIVVAAARRGFIAEGVELNFWLVMYSKLLALRNGQFAGTTFHQKDLWTFNLKPYENVVIFGVKEMMDELGRKFDEELIDSHVVACRFPLPRKRPVSTFGSGADTVWLYQFKR